jgi:hypothetical protein
MIEVPTDWTVYIQYNIGYLDGYLKVNSEALEYSAADADHITNDWSPTGTYYLSPEQRQRMEEEAQAQLETLS